METFHPSSLDIGTKFRESIRYHIPTEHLNQAQKILTDALQKHGEEELTHKNFDKVMEHVHEDPRWHGLHSHQTAFEDALKTHLKMPTETA